MKLILEYFWRTFSLFRNIQFSASSNNKWSLSFSADPTYTNSNGSTSTTYHYIYGNIAVINVNPDGTIDWNIKIPKYQHTVNDNGMWSSYMRFVRNDGIYFIYNDHLENLTRKEGKIFGSPLVGKNAVITVTKVGLDGSMQRFYLSKYIDDKLIAIPKKSAQVNATEAYMQFFIRKGRKHQDVILSFEE